LPEELLYSFYHVNLLDVGHAVPPCLQTAKKVMYGKFVLAGGSVWMRPFTGSVYATRDMVRNYVFIAGMPSLLTRQQDYAILAIRFFKTR
jgi:hypothetical protein